MAHFDEIDKVLPDSELVTKVIQRTDLLLHYKYKAVPMQLHPLQKAILLGYENSAIALATESNLLIPGQNGWNAFETACHMRNKRLLDAFFKHFNFHECPISLIIMCIENGDLEMLRFVLCKGAPRFPNYMSTCPCCRKRYPTTFLQLAAERRQMHILLYLGTIWITRAFVPHDQATFDLEDLFRWDMFESALENHYSVRAIRLMCENNVPRIPHSNPEVEQILQSFFHLLCTEKSSDLLVERIRSKNPECAAIEYIRNVLAGIQVEYDFPCTVARWLRGTAVASELYMFGHDLRKIIFQYCSERKSPISIVPT
jgi:hypothetical protein